jgi:hypothetical protein
MAEEIPSYYCIRIKSQVMAESMNNISSRIAVGCQYYTNWDGRTNKYPCNRDYPKFRKCLVRLAVQKETKEKSKLIQ